MVYVHRGVLFSPKEKIILFSEEWMELRSLCEEKLPGRQTPRFLSFVSSQLYIATQIIYVLFMIIDVGLWEY